MLRFGGRMSALGQKQTLQRILLMSALPPKTDIGTQPRDVRFVPKADICSAAKIPFFNHLAADAEHRRRHGEGKQSWQSVVDCEPEMA